MINIRLRDRLPDVWAVSVHEWGQRSSRGYRVRRCGSRPIKPNRLPITELLVDDSNAARGELLWRIGLPVSALVLALLAIPLSYVNPRAGRSANMIIAILIYAIYNNVMSVSQAWVAQGKLSFWIGVWAGHALMLLPVLLLFYQRTVIRMPWQKRAS